MIKFIKDNLKTQINYIEAPNLERDPVRNSMGQTFYNKFYQTNFSSQKNNKLLNKKVMLRQLSTAAVTNYNFKQENTKFYSKTPEKFPVKRVHKKNSSNIQLVPH